MKPVHHHLDTPVPSAPRSLLMASAWQRLLGAAVLLSLLWAAVAWALSD